MSYEFSYAPTNRASCKGACKEKIDKGAIRLATHSEGMGDFTVASYRCLACVTDKQIANMKSALGGLDKVPGFDLLSADDQALVLAKDPDVPKPAAKAKAKAAPARAPPKAKAEAKAKAKAAPARPPPVETQHKFLDKAKDYDFEGVKEMLDEHPGLLNVQPAGRWSALHQFAGVGNAEAVEYLLGLGADRTVKTKEGKTPLDVATDEVKALFEEKVEDEPMEEEAEEEEAPPEPAAAPEDTKAAETAKRKAAAAALKTVTPAASSGEPPAKKAKTGGRPVDSAVPNRTNYTVLDDWSVLLNQTNVVANNNKYYRIQVLQSKDGYSLWTHWGRVGAHGAHELNNFGAGDHGKDCAQTSFKTKFKQKSGVHYDNINTHDWTPVVGKYTLVETDDQEGAEGGESAPLGKLTPAQIEKGQAVLAKLEAALGKKDAYTLQNLSSEFYTLIPHNFGFKVPPTINTKEMLEEEEELLKFYLRMGFEEMDKVDGGLTPVSGIKDIPLPATLDDACKKVCPAAAIKKSNTRGATHAEKQSGAPAKKMEAPLYAAIMLYTSNAIYKELNAALRSEDRTKIKKYFPYLRMLLEALGRLPQQKRTLWRGVNVDLFDQYPVGKTVTWWGVSSCTSQLGVAQAFMSGCGGKCTLLTVETTTAADISEITFYGHEKESLLAPGTQFKVLSAEKKGLITEIKMKEVGRVLE